MNRQITQLPITCKDLVRYLGCKLVKCGGGGKPVQYSAPLFRLVVLQEKEFRAIVAPNGKKEVIC